MDDAEKNGGIASERLIVVENDGTFVVASEDDPSDWVASFTQHETFAAQEWAERMADLFNLRTQENQPDDPEKAPPFTGSHHPQNQAKT
jgi:hypothetical protein